MMWIYMTPIFAALGFLIVGTFAEPAIELFLDAAYAVREWVWSKFQ